MYSAGVLILCVNILQAGAIPAPGFYKECKTEEFLCQVEQTCIPKSWLCDSAYDCTDASDEVNCTDAIRTTPNNIPSCSSVEFLCKSDKLCVPIDWKCDGSQDCSDRSDEKDCQLGACNSNEIACITSGECIKLDFLCDGDFDCMDKSDEHGCKEIDVHKSLETSNGDNASTSRQILNDSAEEPGKLNDTIKEIIQSDEKVFENDTVSSNIVDNLTHYDIIEDVHLGRGDGNLDEKLIMQGNDLKLNNDQEDMGQLEQTFSNDTDSSDMDSSLLRDDLIEEVNVNQQNIDEDLIFNGNYLNSTNNFTNQIDTDAYMSELNDSFSNETEYNIEFDSAFENITIAMTENLTSDTTTQPNYDSVQDGSFDMFTIGKFNDSDDTTTEGQIITKDDESMVFTFKNTSDVNLTDTLFDSADSLFNDSIIYNEILTEYYNIGEHFNYSFTRKPENMTDESSTHISTEVVTTVTPTTTTESTTIPTTTSTTTTTPATTVTTTIPTTTTYNPCNRDEFHCRISSSYDSTCIPVEWKCDQVADCSDGSDEINCGLECPNDMAKCQDTGRCIYHTWICDGQRDCDNGSDEFYC